MATPTTDDPRPDASSRTAIEQPSASASESATAPEVAAPHATSEPDLESRIKEQRAALIGKLGELRGDLRPGVVESRAKLKARLSELAHIVKWGLIDGWPNVGAPVRNKLEQWLSESTTQLVARHEHA